VRDTFVDLLKLSAGAGGVNWCYTWCVIVAIENLGTLTEVCLSKELVAKAIEPLNSVSPN